MGHRFYDWALADITDDRPGHRHLLVRRNRRTGEIAFFRCHPADRVPLSTAVRVAGRKVESGQTRQSASHLVSVIEVEVPGRVELGVPDGERVGRELLAGRRDVCVPGDAQHVLAVRIHALGRRGQDDGQVREPVRFGDYALEGLKSLRDQPAAEVLEAVVGASAVDEVGGGPQRVRVGVSRQVPQHLLSGNNVLRRVSGQQRGCFAGDRFARVRVEAPSRTTTRRRAPSSQRGHPPPGVPRL
ncbi:hypothetical protein GA0115240_135228 [Streptomyces sp. DvalAA-14]|nr:hypothetical protein GA0115240_135228 [Streptomyces sp. DvalAA-14]